jgi:hypothetical protein
LSNVVSAWIRPVKKPFAERAEGHEADAELFERRDHVSLGYPVPERLLALQRSDRLDGVRTTAGLRTCLGDTERLEKLGVNHIAFTVADIEAEVAKRQAPGVEMRNEVIDFTHASSSSSQDPRA